MVNFLAPVCVYLYEFIHVKPNRRANFGATNFVLFLNRVDPVWNVSGKQTNKL